MDGRGAWRDNVFVERLWRSVKYEEIYLRAYDTVAEASLARYFGFYNSRIRALTGKHLISHPASADRGSLNPAGAPLIRRKSCSDKRSHLSVTIPCR
jgi:hypothetical protein